MQRKLLSQSQTKVQLSQMKDSHDILVSTLVKLNLASLSKTTLYHLIVGGVIGARQPEIPSQHATRL